MNNLIIEFQLNSGYNGCQRNTYENNKLRGV